MRYPAPLPSPSVNTVTKPVKRLPPVTLLVAYLLFGVFVMSESRMRQGRAASTLQAGEHDQGTTRQVGTAFGAALLLTPVVTLLRPKGHVPAFVGPSVIGAGDCPPHLGRGHARSLLHAHVAHRG